MWIFFAAGSALFAGATAILAKCGIRKTDSTVATAIRTIVVLVFAWIMVLVAGSQDQLGSLGGTTLLFVSHDINQVKQLCKRAIWIDHGHLRGDGPSAEVCDAYVAAMQRGE